MNRLFPFAFALLFLPGISLAQNYENALQVISASGQSGTQGGLTFTYTVGEPVVTTLSGTSRIVTQGFHQPELGIVAVHDLDLLEWNIEVFPNPTADVLTVRFSDEQGSALRATVFNLLGEVMLSGQQLTQPDGSRLDCSAWQPGVYLLQLQDPTTSGVAFVRFIRL